ncbi:MAG: hypothetical protein CTY36_11015 [Methylocystis sp.]|nr:MAG: hypothetical protein CTY36_11015 [Methylocystis sp.]
MTWINAASRAAPIIRPTAWPARSIDRLLRQIGGLKLFGPGNLQFEKTADRASPIGARLAGVAPNERGDA